MGGWRSDSRRRTRHGSAGRKGTLRLMMSDSTHKSHPAALGGMAFVIVDQAKWVASYMRTERLKAISANHMLMTVKMLITLKESHNERLAGEPKAKVRMASIR
jgi:hypothetical protein